MINVIIPNEEYSYADDAAKAALVTAGIGAAATLGANLVQKQRPLSDIEKVCGKKPKIGKGKKQAWQDCANKVLPKNNSPETSKDDKTKKDNKMLYIIGGSIVGLGVIGLLIYKLKK